VPTYQYTCTECGQRLEAVQSFSDPALTDCPNCHGRLRKVFNSVGIVFKGSGFSRNDSRAGNGASSDVKAESTKPESAPASPAASSSSTSSTSPSSSTPTSAKAAPAPA
jgi:putative FmdB family regulatory protein